MQLGVADLRMQPVHQRLPVAVDLIRHQAVLDELAHPARAVRVLGGEADPHRPVERPRAAPRAAQLGRRGRPDRPALLVPHVIHPPRQARRRLRPQHRLRREQVLQRRGHAGGVSASSAVAPPTAAPIEAAAPDTPEAAASTAATLVVSGPRSTPLAASAAFSDSMSPRSPASAVFSSPTLADSADWPSVIDRSAVSSLARSASTSAWVAMSPILVKIAFSREMTVSRPSMLSRRSPVATAPR